MAGASTAVSGWGEAGGGPTPDAGSSVAITKAPAQSWCAKPTAAAGGVTARKGVLKVLDVPYDVRALRLKRGATSTHAPQRVGPYLCAFLRPARALKLKSSTLPRCCLYRPSLVNGRALRLHWSRAWHAWCTAESAARSGVPMEAPHVPARVRHSSSQYDFVKVRVWLGDGEDRHATVLSRFLLVRTLTAAKVADLCASPCSAPLTPCCAGAVRRRRQGCTARQEGAG